MILVGGQTMKTLTELTDAYGPRLTGSDVHRGAASWAADRFRSYGVDATLESFTLERSWVRGEATAKMVAPKEQALHVAAFGWTPGTPGSIRAEVIAPDDVTPEALAKRKDLKGKIALFGREQSDKLRKGYAGYGVAQAGAVAMLYDAGMPGNAHWVSTADAPKGAAFPAPYVTIGHEDAELLRRMLEKGPVTIDLSSTAQLGGPVEVPNVVAEIKGREKPDEVVMVGAHLDSWDYANGAQDNGSGSAQVLEAARAIRALGTAPRRTVRFALWGGEEEGLFGSRAYVKAHAAELDRVVSYVNTDFGAGAPTGWDLDDRDDVKDAMKPMAKSLLAGVGADTLETKLRCDTDHCPFWMQGVPTFNLDVDGSHYGEIHHLATDTVDKVKDAALSQGAAAVAVMAYVLAELPDRVAPRLTHAQVAKHVKDDGQGLMPWIVDEGYWKP
jgi:hypothetical protein